ncbi:hypothetical protein EB118_03545 [bacterium]|nr:hypothetical protein [bacterium]NDC94054.1 hypothetical protein [bacterium]NDD82740.1 hypothetical protein [bacterium]NDG29160.1 hypothetical protein [bacterium]
MQSAIVHIIIVGLLFLGSLHLLVTSAGIKYSIGTRYAREIAILTGMAGIYLSSQRDFYLPFLGSAVYPYNLVKTTIPKDAHLKVVIHCDTDATKVVYWGANEGAVPFKDPQSAYKDTPNVGVAEVSDGSALLEFMCPQRYNVRGKLLDRHIHYRMVHDNGMLGPVKTLKVNC